MKKQNSKKQDFKLAFSRVMLKLSGEILGGESGVGAEGAALARMAHEIATLVDEGLQIAVVVGGGNFWRYRDNESLALNRSTSDAMGMLATIMNGRLLQEALAAEGVSAQVLSPHVDGYFADLYSPACGRELLDIGEVVICAGGTGNPYFTTDSAAALRALELGCEVLVKGTKVDGVYDQDPRRFKDAQRFDTLSYEEVLKRELEVMDLTAVVLCKENKLPIVVCRGQEDGDLLRALRGEAPSTRIA